MLLVETKYMEQEETDVFQRMGHISLLQQIELFLQLALGWKCHMDGVASQPVVIVPILSPLPINLLQSSLLEMIQHNFVVPSLHAIV